MHLRITLAQLLVLAPLGALAACDPPVAASRDAPDAASRDAGPRSSDGAPISCGSGTLFTGEPTEAAEVGALSDGAFTAWQSGDAVPFVWGFQGGVMITPTVRAPRGITASGERCVLVEIQHLEPGGGRAFESFRTFAARLDATEIAGALELESLFDQIGWSEIPRDTPLTLDVTVRGTRAAAHTRLELRVVPPSSGLPAHCDALPTTGSGCRYRSLPAMARVLEVRPRTEDDGAPICPESTRDPRIVELEVTVDAPYRDCASAPTRTTSLTIEGYLAPPAACLAAIGLEEGSTFAVTVEESFAGTCTPFLLRTTVLDDPACTEACLGRR